MKFKITRYTNIVLSHRQQINKYTKEKKVVRPKEGREILKLMGRCLDAGGCVEMETRYLPQHVTPRYHVYKDVELADITLRWNQ